MLKFSIVLLLAVACFADNFGEDIFGEKSFGETKDPSDETKGFDNTKTKDPNDETKSFDNTEKFDDDTITEESDDTDQSDDTEKVDDTDSFDDADKFDDSDLFDDTEDFDDSEESDGESDEEFDAGADIPGVKYLDGAREALLKFAATLRKGKNVTNAFLKVIDGFERKIADFRASLGRRRVDPNLIKKIEEFIKEASRDRKANTNIVQALAAKGILLSQITSEKTRAKRSNVLLEGALAFLESIKEDIGEEAFDEFLSVRGLVTLIFVIDDTGSMSGDIRAAIAIATQIVTAPQRDYEVDYILSPFNDPKTGPITVKNETQGEEFVTALEKLRAHGGGDCPELAFKGMLDAIDAGPQPGSSMYVFTDASPKDATPENTETLLNNALDLGIFINFFSRGDCSKPDSIAVYDKLAEETGGYVYPLKSELEITELGKLVSKTLGGSVTTGSGGSGSPTGRRRRATASQYSISVDDTIDQIIITVITQNSGAGVTLLDPTGKTVTEGRTSLAKGVVYDLAHPVAGVYKLVVPVTAGAHKYRVNAVSSINIDFGHYYAFIPKRGRDRVPVPLEQPLEGFPAKVFITVAGAEFVKAASLSIKVIDKSGTVRADKALSPIGTSGVRYIVEFDAPSGPFRLQLNGQTRKGNAFVRMAAREDKATSVDIRPRNTPGSNVLFRGKRTRRTFQIRRGDVGDSVETYILSLKDQRGYGKVSRQPRPVRRGRIGFARIEFTVPGDAPKGKNEKVEVYLTKKGESKPVATLILSLLIV